jgi:transposase
MVIAPEKLPDMSADELRDVVQSLFKTLTFKQATIDKLTHENATLKRLKFAAQSERFSAEQRSLLDETLDADLQAVNDEIEQLQSDDAAQPKTKQHPKRQMLPANLPRTDIHHEPDSTTCQCGCQLKRIGEDVAEKLDYVPGIFSRPCKIHFKPAPSADLSFGAG